MDKLVQHIKMDMPGIPKQGLYCYGEASFEANQAMQEPLEKLYKYENQPDMREKVREYISELNKEIKRCMNWQDNNYYKLGSLEFEKMCSRVMTLQEVRNDLKGRLEELI